MLQVDWPRTFLPITGESVFCLMWNWWWISITILVLILDYFQEKLMTKFFKKSEKPYFGVIWGLFCANLGKNEFSGKKGTFYHFSNYIPWRKICEKNWWPNPEKNAERTERQTDRQWFCRTLCRTGSINDVQDMEEWHCDADVTNKKIVILLLLNFCKFPLLQLFYLVIPMKWFISSK